MATLVAAVLLFAAFGYWRIRSLKPLWSWTDTVLQLGVGSRIYEVQLPEVRRVAAGHGQLIVESAQGFVPFPARWVVPELVGALAAACGRTPDEVTRALAGKDTVELWRGALGTWRLPPKA